MHHFICNMNHYKVAKQIKSLHQQYLVSFRVPSRNAVVIRPTALGLSQFILIYIYISFLIEMYPWWAEETSFININLHSSGERLTDSMIQELTFLFFSFLLFNPRQPEWSWSPLCWHCDLCERIQQSGYIWHLKPDFKKPKTGDKIYYK